MWIVTTHIPGAPLVPETTKWLWQSNHFIPTLLQCFASGFWLGLAFFFLH
jgi:hypothetical protein